MRSLSACLLLLLVADSTTADHPHGLIGYQIKIGSSGLLPQKTLKLVEVKEDSIVVYDTARQTKVLPNGTIRTDINFRPRPHTFFEIPVATDDLPSKGKLLQPYFNQFRVYKVIKKAKYNQKIGKARARGQLFVLKDVGPGLVNVRAKGATGKARFAAIDQVLSDTVAVAYCTNERSEKVLIEVLVPKFTEGDVFDGITPTTEYLETVSWENLGTKTLKSISGAPITLPYLRQLADEKSP